jgi:hypothetical protein
MAVQQGQHVDAVGRPTFFSGLINIFVFDLFQAPIWCIAATCNPLATGLDIFSF